MSPMNKRFVNCQIPKPDWVWKERTTTPSQLPSFDPELNRVESSAHLKASPWRLPAGACTPARNRAGPHDIDCWINFWKPHTNAAETLLTDNTRTANRYNGTLVQIVTSNRNIRMRMRFLAGLVVCLCLPFSTLWAQKYVISTVAGGSPAPASAAATSVA